jgi:hypothetical protein
VRCRRRLRRPGVFPPVALLRLSRGCVGLIFQTVLEQQVHVVALVEDLALDVGVELLQAAYLAVLLRHELLVERRDLDVEIELRKVEVGREAVRDVARSIPIDVERRRFVEPLDLVEVEELCELPLAVVGELYRRVGPRFGVGAALSANCPGDGSLSDG